MRNRPNSEMRDFKFERNFTKHAAGSVLVSYGDTKVICTASVEERVPHFLKDTGSGWITAEYGLLPGSTNTRVRREVSNGKPSGRTSEIQRLIGRSLRSIVDLSKLNEKSIFIDADVIQADGGTRTAAITGGMIALWDAVQSLIKKGELKENPITEFLAAISVGVLNGKVICDLCYEEDSKAEVDMNIVMTESGKFIEIQGTAEEAPFTHDQLLEMIDISKQPILSMIKEIKATLQK